MSSSVWAGHSATVVILPAGNEGGQLLELAEQWVEAGYLSNAIWLRPEDARFPVNEAPSVPVLVIGVSRTHELLKERIDLFQELARNRLEKVRLVVVRPIHSGHALDEQQSSIVESVAQYAEWSLPLLTGDTDKDHTQLIKINLVCAPTRFQVSRQENLIEPMWDLNVIAAAEDRGTPWSGDAFVREDERFTGFVLMHVATCGGLWNGLPESPLDNLEDSRPGQIWVPRVFVDGVVTEGLARRVAARVLQRLVVTTSTTVAQLALTPIPGTVRIEDEDVDSWLEWMVGQTLTFDANRLTYVPPTPYQVPPVGRILELQQLSSFSGFSLGTFAAIPKWIWRWIRRRVGRSMTGWFQGPDGMWTVGIAQLNDIDVRDRTLVLQFQELERTAAAAAAALENPVQKVTKERSTPTLWRQIRRLVFGMLDGSDIADLGVQRTENGVPVLGSVTDLFQHSADMWELPDFVKTNGPRSITWTNMDQISELERAIEESIRLVELEARTAESKLAELRKDEQHWETEHANLAEALASYRAVSGGAE